MKKIVTTFLIFCILMVTLSSCKSELSEGDVSEILMREAEESTGDESAENTEAAESITVSSPSSFSKIYDGLNAFSLEEYNSKIDKETKFCNLPNDPLADFTKFGFDVKQICQEWEVDDNGKHLEYEDMSIEYHNDKCTDGNEYHNNDCRLKLSIKKISSKFDMTREEYVFLKEVDGMQIHKTKPESQLNRWTTYTITINKQCNITVSIPQHLSDMISEDQSEQILNQAISLAKVIRDTLAETDVN